MPRYSDDVDPGKWAQRQGVSDTAAGRRLAAGKLPVPARRVGGLTLVGEPAVPGPDGLTAVYAPVSSADQKARMGRQVARVTFLAILRGLSVATVVVQHRDRFARFGPEYVEAALAASGRRLQAADRAGSMTTWCRT